MLVEFLLVVVLTITMTHNARSNRRKKFISQQVSPRETRSSRIVASQRSEQNLIHTCKSRRLCLLFSYFTLLSRWINSLRLQFKFTFGSRSSYIVAENICLYICHILHDSFVSSKQLTDDQ